MGNQALDKRLRELRLISCCEVAVIACSVLVVVLILLMLLFRQHIFVDGMSVTYYGFSVGAASTGGLINLYLRRHEETPLSHASGYAGGICILGVLVFTGCMLFS